MTSYLLLPAKSARRPRHANPILLPASLLAYKHHWQPKASTLPTEGILIVIPISARPAIAMLATARVLATKGFTVRVLSSGAYSPAGLLAEDTEARLSKTSQRAKMRTGIPTG